MERATGDTPSLCKKTPPRQCPSGKAGNTRTAPSGQTRNLSFPVPHPWHWPPVDTYRKEHKSRTTMRCYCPAHLLHLRWFTPNCLFLCTAQPSTALLTQISSVMFLNPYSLWQPGFGFRKSRPTKEEIMACSSSVPVVEQERAICSEQYPSVLLGLRVLTHFPVEPRFAV